MFEWTIDGRDPTRGNARIACRRVQLRMPEKGLDKTNIDPLLEHAILRCLARSPGDRPRSPYEVAAALPGGDPLAAALAAGETPSPGMVAASGRKEGLRPSRAWPLFAFVLAVLTAVSWIFNPSKVPTAAFQESPDGLARAARDVLRGAGYTAASADSASGFEIDEDAVAWNQEFENAARPTPVSRSGSVTLTLSPDSAEPMPPKLIEPVAP